MSNLPVNHREFTAVGMMSGTSMDGIDLAYISTDGFAVSSIGPSDSFPYDTELRQALRKTIDECSAQVWPEENVRLLEKAITEAHANAFHQFLRANEISFRRVDLIGFHGHTIKHDPANKCTCQIGDAELLASDTGVDVVFDLRQNDVRNGGQGAPLAPLFHAALFKSPCVTKLPTSDIVAILNIGGIANVTWVHASDLCLSSGKGVLAFDTGPGNCLIDDWALKHTGYPADVDGQLAARGRVDSYAVGQAVKKYSSFLNRSPPKSLDRLDFCDVKASVSHLGVEDGAATLTHFTAVCVAAALPHFPFPPSCWYICGGGRKNPTLMKALELVLHSPVMVVEDLGWDGDALEAQAFAFLAVRSLKELPISFPSTTGVAEPMVGGRLFLGRDRQQ